MAAPAPATTDLAVAGAPSGPASSTVSGIAPGLEAGLAGEVQQHRVLRDQPQRRSLIPGGLLPLRPGQPVPRAAVLVRELPR